jgi:hypothetical protein
MTANPAAHLMQAPVASTSKHWIDCLRQELFKSTNPETQAAHFAGVEFVKAAQYATEGTQVLLAYALVIV